MLMPQKDQHSGGFVEAFGKGIELSEVQQNIPE
jgi:hypothetical protein